MQFRASFAKDLRSIRDKELLRKIAEVVEEVERAGALKDVNGLKKLRGGRDYFRIRVGEHRIGLAVSGAVVTFVRCLDRKEIYRYFP